MTIQKPTKKAREPKWAEKQLHGYLKRQIPEVARHTAEKGNLQKRIC